MPKYWALAATLAASVGFAFAAHAQTIPDEYNRKIAGHSELGTLSGDFAGDRIDLGSGSLEIAQTDIDLPGNNALPVRVGRYFQPAYVNFGGHFGDWRMDLPSVHGTFADVAMGGWKTESLSGGYTSNRCSSFGRPPDGFSRMPTKSDVIWGADDYWHGTFFHLPGSGEQELLNFWGSGRVPADGHAYHAMTKAGAVARCVALASTGDDSIVGEGFEIVTPDGTVYTLNQMVKRNLPALAKGPDALPRSDYFLYPTRVADRFGNTVTYTWNDASPWQLLSIVASDGRRLDFTYAAPGSMLVATVTDGSRTWHYGASTDPGDPGYTVTLPDGRFWRLRLSNLTSMLSSTGTTHCNGINGITQRTTYDDGSGTTGYVGSITGPSGATATFTLARILLGRSHVPYNCVTDSAGADISQARPDDPYLFYTAAVVGKTISGPGLPAGGLHWGYAYGPTNNCWDGFPANDSLRGLSCVQTPSPGTRSVLAMDPTGAVTRYTFGNRSDVDEGMLYTTESGWNGASALRTVQVAYGDAGAAPYGGYDGFSPRGFGDPALTSRNQPQRKITTIEQGTTFTWEVPASCSGMPYCFDAYARPTSVVHTGINAPAKVETIAYDDDTVRWVLGQVAQRTIDGVVAAQTTFDAAHLPWKTYAFGKLRNTFTYNADGTIATVADGNNNVTTYSSWKRGIPQSVHFPATAESPSGATRSAVVRDEGWISSVTDENGFATGYAYDAMGRITQVTYPAGDSVAWAPTTSVFEPVGAAEYGIAAGHWRQTLSTGNARKITFFDALWRPVLVREYDAANVAGTDRYAATAYDNAGRVADAAYPLGAAPTMTGAATWLLGGARPNGVRTGYDALGRPTTVQQDSELGVLTTTTEYLAGFQRRVTDARGHATTTQYMAWDAPTFDWPVQVDAPEGKRTLIARDGFGKPNSIQVAGTSVTRSYAYNGYQELCRVDEPETGATLMGYDGAGNLAWSASGLPLQTACSDTGSGVARKAVRAYDARNRVTTLQFPDLNGNQSWTYTPDGLPDTVTAWNDGGATSVINTYVYNRRRLLTAESSGQPGWYTWWVNHDYDANGHQSRVTNPDTSVVDYAPNALGQPTQASYYATNVSYYPNGALKQFTYGNGIVHTLTQNARGLPATSQDAYGATAIHQDEYAYDQVGNVLYITDAATGQNQRGNRSMAYDGLDRLTSATSPMFGTASYAYDVLDNLTHVTVTGGSQARDQGYVYDANNRLANLTSGGATVVGLGYDVQGNLANKNGVPYVFDYGNRLREVSGREYYRYDAAGRRVLGWTQTAGSILSVYGHDGVLRFQLNQRNLLYIDYIYLGGSLVAIQNYAYATGTGEVKYQHTDALGSPVAVTDANRTVLQRSEYEPYGYLLNRPVEDGPGYTGHVSDAATGLINMQQRYYDPLIGHHFLSVDPVTPNSPGGAFNRYWYANANPYRFTDPDGRVSYQRGNTVVIPIYYQGSGATDEFIKAQVQAASALVAEDGTKFEIVPMKNNLFPRSNIMDVSPGTNPNTIEGEGIVKDTNGSAAHIDSTRSDVAGATLHDSLHFVPGLSDGRKSDGYTQGTDQDGNRVRTGYKAGFGPDQIMANTGGNMLKSFETSFMNDAFNGNGSAEDLEKLLKDDAK